MSGAHNLGVSELTIEAKGKKGKAYLDAVAAEMTGDHVTNEGSMEDNKETSDKIMHVDDCECDDCM